MMKRSLVALMVVVSFVLTAVAQPVDKDAIEKIKEQGYAIDNEEITRGLVCVAAPISGGDGNVAGAVSCTVPRHVNDEKSLAARIKSVSRLAAKASAGEKV